MAVTWLAHLDYRQFKWWLLVSYEPHVPLQNPLNMQCNTQSLTKGTCDHTHPDLVVILSVVTWQVLQISPFSCCKQNPQGNPQTTSAFCRFVGCVHLLGKATSGWPLLLQHFIIHVCNHPLTKTSHCNKAVGFVAQTKNNWLSLSFTIRRNIHARNIHMSVLTF